jgi:hypothetical protein
MKGSNHSRVLGSKQPFVSVTPIESLQNGLITGGRHESHQGVPKTIGVRDPNYVK